MHVWLNSHASAITSEAGVPPTREPLAFHRRLPQYEATPLRDTPGLAEVLGVARVFVKDESRRMGMPAFKILGASWAAYKALEARCGPLEPWSNIEDLRARLAGVGPLCLSAATDGNHGRAVARVARMLGLRASIFVPLGTSDARITAIESEGATVTVVRGTYDDAVAASAATVDDRTVIISDTSWPGYEDVPRWVIEGYSTILWEIDDELRARGEPPVDLIAVQVGVGALAAAVVDYVRHSRGPGLILGVEPLSAACVLASARAGGITTVPGPHDSIMAGLNCGTPSLVAWPRLSTGIDAFVAVEDERAREAMRRFAAVGIVAGETGAAGLAGLLALRGEEPGAAEARRALRIGSSTRVLLLCTEGATDPGAYERIVNSSAAPANR